MSQPFIEIEVTGAELPEQAQSVEVRLRDLMQVLADDHRTSIRKTMDLGGRPMWKKLASGGARKLIKSRMLYNSFLTRTSSTSYEVYTTVPYAAIQNFGGITNPTVTKKMRRYAWMRYMTGGNQFQNGLGLNERPEMWRNIALTRKRTLVVIIPKSPFMVFHKEDEQNIVNKLGDMVTEIWLGPAYTRNVTSKNTKVRRFTQFE